MTLEKIRRKARELHSKTRRELLGSIAIPVIVIGLSGWGAVLTYDPALRLVFTLAIAWALSGQYFLHRGMWPAPQPGDAALSTGLEFYRREITRRRSLFARVPPWSFGPAVLSVGAWILEVVRIGIRKNLQPSVRMIPFFTLLAIWLVTVFVLRMRQQRELQGELDELNKIEIEHLDR